MSLLLYHILTACILWFTGYFHHGKYVRPKWKIPGKFLFYTLVTGILTHWFQYYALIFIIGHPLIGLLFYIKICKKYDIDWKTCKPLDKYLDLQEKWAKGKWN